MAVVVYPYVLVLGIEPILLNLTRAATRLKGLWGCISMGWSSNQQNDKKVMTLSHKRTVIKCNGLVIFSTSQVFYIFLLSM